MGAKLSSADSGPLLSVNNLSITFDGLPAGFALVDNVSFAVGRGKTLCIVGESGCGKSLVSLALMGLLACPPAQVLDGDIIFDGENLRKVSASRLADLRGDRLAMIFQEPMTSLNPAYSIGDQIAEAVIRHRKVSRVAARERALELLRRVSIPAAERRLDAYPHQLSGGMRQRAMIAMALANDPQLLIADEPTTALDVTIQAQILRLVRELQKAIGSALILVTHDLGVVAEIADEVAVMYAGRIVETGSAAAVFDDPQHPYTLGLMGSLPSIGRREGRLAAIPGAVPPPGGWPSGCRFSSRCPFADSQCRAAAPQLGDFGSGHKVSCFKAPIELSVEMAS